MTHKITTLALVGACVATTGQAAEQAPPPVSSGEALPPGNTQFTKDLYGKLKEKPGNLFLSPYSISTALAMTYGGARGETEKQMAQTLHFTVPQAELHPAFAKLQTGLAAVQAKGKVKLAVANSLWPQQEYHFLPSYLELCKAHYGTSVTPVNYKGATEAARTSINNWVETKTEQKIQELFKPGVLDSLTRLVLVNAIYFKGNWASQFKKEATQPAPFHLTDGKEAEVPMMARTAEFNYGETADAQLLELPYDGNDLSMLIVLPRKLDGLPAVETKFCEGKLSEWTAAMRKQKTQVTMPKFKVTSEFSLNDTLSAMGMKDAFSREADFSGMDGSKNLYISAVVHKAFVEVDEQGTEAAAATGVAMSVRSAPMKPAVFRADHPFLFLIRDHASGTILFLGRIVDPMK